MSEQANLTPSEPPKKRSRARPTQPAVVEPHGEPAGVQQLLLEVRELAGQLKALQEEVRSLRSGSEAVSLPKPAEDASAHTAQAEPASQAPEEPVVEALPVSEPMTSLVVEDQSFQPGPFDLDKFAEELHNAMANPEAVDWDGDFLHREPPPAPPPNILDEQEWLADMKGRYPRLFEEIDQYNLENGLLDAGASAWLWPSDAPSDELDAIGEPEFVDLSEPIMEDLPPWASADSSALGPQAETTEPTLKIGFSAFHGGADVDTSIDPAREPSPQSTTTRFQPHEDALAAVPLELAAAALILPLRLEAGTLHCLAAEPVNKEGLQGLGAALGLRVEPQPSSLSDVVHGLRQAYSEEGETEARDALIPATAPAVKRSLADRLLKVFRRAA